MRPLRRCMLLLTLLGSFSGPDPGVAVTRYLTRAEMQEPGTVPLMATYRIVAGHCGHWADPPSDQSAYHNWVSSFASGIGDFRAVLFLEMDSLITTPCLTSHGVAVRMAELRDAINVLTTNCPRLVIYLDAARARGQAGCRAPRFRPAPGRRRRDARDDAGPQRRLSREVGGGGGARRAPGHPDQRR